jgi:hypothetical protein
MSHVRSPTPVSEEEDDSTSYLALKDALTEYHDAGREGHCKPNQCPTYMITETPTAMLTSEKNKMVLLVWTSAVRKPEPHVFFAEPEFHRLLLELADKGNDVYTKLAVMDIRPNEEGGIETFGTYEVYLAYLFDDQCE